MQANSITLQVSPEAALRWQDSSPEEQERIQRLVEYSLLDREKAILELENIMDDIARKARERGFTEDMLGDLLDVE